MLHREITSNINKNLIQQRFNNEAQVAAGKTNQYDKQGQLAVQQGQNTGNFYSNLGNTGAGIASTVADSGVQNDRNKLLDDYLKKQKQGGV